MHHPALYLRTINALVLPWVRVLPRNFYHEAYYSSFSVTLALYSPKKDFESESVVLTDA